MTSETKTIVFTVEGSIGAGKTTLLKEIENLNCADIYVLYEPVDEWMKIGQSETGTGLFELYYKDKARYGFLFQMCALQTRIKNLVECIKANPGKIILTERCYMTDYEIFAKMLSEQGYISPIEYMVYKEWFELVTKMASLTVQGIIYLDIPYTECVTRIAKRDRRGEGGIDLNYLKMLGETHEKWIGSTKLPLLKISQHMNGDPAGKVVKWVQSHRADDMV